jgi:hypothetical protein
MRRFRKPKIGSSNPPRGLFFYMSKHLKIVYNISANMLDLISRVKEEHWARRFDPDTLNWFSQILRKKSFLAQFPKLIFSSHVEVKVIIDPSTLEDYALRSDSCLFREKGQEQIDAFSRFLQDPGALYLGIKSKDHTGYVRFYAGQVEGEDQILFEDALFTKPDKLENRKELFQPDFKSVSLRILRDLNVISKGYLFCRDIPFEQEGPFTSDPLHIKKMSSDFFKKGRVPCFYKGEYYLNESIWPSYARADHLLG